MPPRTGSTAGGRRCCAVEPSSAAARMLLGVVVAACVGCGVVPGRELFLEPVPLRRADAIVVLGNRPAVDSHGRVAPEVARRVRRGVELFHRGLAPRLVVTGGPGAGVVEADVMAAYAESLGVPRPTILRERRARDTAENAGFTVRALCGERERPCAPRVIVVTSPYHLRRAVRLFRCAGAHVQHAASDRPSDIGAQFAATAHEFGVSLLYLVDDACTRAASAANAGPPSEARR